MIDFKDFPTRTSKNTAIIYTSSLKQIKEMYKVNPEWAGELAISICELAITGQMSCENPIVRMALANFEDVAIKNIEKYDQAIVAKIEGRIQKNSFREIARALKNGVKQVDIAKELNLKTTTLGERVKTLRLEFPFLLENPDLPVLDFPQEVLNNTKNPKNSVGKTWIFEENANIQKNTESPELDNLEELDIYPENPENPRHVHDNVNVNDNVNVSPSPDGEELPSVPLSELHRLGVSFIWLDGETVQVKDTRKIFHVEV